MTKLKPFFLLAFMLIFVSGLYSATIYVDQSKTLGGDNGTSWTDAYLTLQSALDVAVSGDEIWVATGTYYPSKEVNGTGARYSTFELISGISIYGGFAGDETSTDDRDLSLNITTFSGDIGTEITDWDDFTSSGWNDNVQHVFYGASDGTLWTEAAKIDGCVVTGGFAQGAGTNFGGGIYLYEGGYAEIINCTFEYNYAVTFGGAIANFRNGKIIVENCLITKNKGTGETGGIWNEVNCTAEVNNCEISYNVGGNSSAMLNLNYSTCIVNNCVFKNNTSTSYGTFLNHNNSTATLNNCIFYDNTNTNSNGGAVTNYLSSSLTANNLTIVENSSPSGAGIYVSTSTSNLNNCIIWGNTGTSGKQIYNDNGTVILDYSSYSNGTNDVFGSITATNAFVNIDPAFVDVASKDFRIFGDSPCADNGNDFYSTEMYDIRGIGFDRKLDKTNGSVGNIDIGAYEFKYGTDPNCDGSNPTDGGSVSSDQTICPMSTIAELLSLTLPTGHIGTLQYQWQKSTESGTTGFTDIATANSDSYLPETISQSTWYKRLSKVDCSPNWTDAAESNVIKITTEDFTDPTITCIDNQEVMAEVSGFYTVSGTEFDPVTFNDDCSVESVINDFNSTSTLAGAEIPEGNTTIIWTVNDYVGNTTDCSFDVSVSEHVGISSIGNSGISIYPNPTNSILNFGFANNTIQKLTISDITGKLLFKKLQVLKNETIDLSDFESGVYIIKIQTNEKIFTKKIIKR